MRKTKLLEFAVAATLSGPLLLLAIPAPALAQALPQNGVFNPFAGLFQTNIPQCTPRVPVPLGSRCTLQTVRGGPACVCDFPDTDAKGGAASSPASVAGGGVGGGGGGGGAGGGSDGGGGGGGPSDTDGGKNNNGFGSD